MTLRPAVEGDVDELVALRDQASRWLATQGSDQWARPWPNAETMVETIAAAVQQGETWLLELGGRTAATVSMNRNIWPGLWSPNELAEPAYYVHRLIVHREFAGLGLGAWLTDWCGILAARQNARWLRADVWTTNTRLQDYYRSIGFEHVRTVHRDDYPSGALFQRPVSRSRDPD